MRFLTWFLTVALLFAWPELTTALLGAAVWAVQSPPVLIVALVFVVLRRMGLRVGPQAVRGWVS